MKAAVLTRLNKPLEIMELDLPKLEVGQVLVRVHAATICGAQIGEQTGAKGADPYLPHLMGHEGSGVVVDVGPGVRRVRVDDQVVMHWRKGLGIDANPPVYECEGKRIGAGPIATFAEYAVISENRLTTIESMRHDIASLFGCAVTTAFGLVNNEAELKIGQSVLVAGCGGVGLNVIQACRLVGASDIVGVDRIESKLLLARQYGATAVEFNVHSVKELVHVFVDCTGNAEVIDRGLQLLLPGGKAILVGQPRVGEVLQISEFQQHYVGKTIMDSVGGRTNPSIDIPLYVKLYRQGRLDLSSLITDRFNLTRINEAFDLVKQGEAGRVALEMTS